MLGIFKYKKLYKQSLNEINNNSIKQKDLLDIKDSIVNLNVMFHQTFSIMQGDIENLCDYNKELEKLTLDQQEKNNKLKLQLALKEKQRKENASRVGGLQKQVNKLTEERKQMMDFINRCINEMSKMSKEKKSPTVEELRKYFRKF